MGDISKKLRASPISGYFRKELSRESRPRQSLMKSPNSGISGECFDG